MGTNWKNIFVILLTFIAVIGCKSISDTNGDDAEIAEKLMWNVFGLHTQTGTHYDPGGYTQNGFDENGNHRDTRNKYNPDGFDIYGFDSNGIHGETYETISPRGFSALGIHEITTLQYNLQGFNIDNIHYETNTYFDSFGFAANGLHRNTMHAFDENGWTRNLIHKDTQTQYGPDGYSIRGFNEEGFHRDTGTKYDPNGYDSIGLKDFEIDILLTSQKTFDDNLFSTANASKPGDSCSRRYSILHARSSVESGALRTEIRLNRAQWLCTPLGDTRLGNDSGLITQYHKPVLDEEGTVNFISEPAKIDGFHWVTDLAGAIGSLTKTFFSPTTVAKNLLEGIDFNEIFESFLGTVTDVGTVLKLVKTVIEGDTILVDGPTQASPNSITKDILKRCKGTINKENVLATVIDENGDIRIQGTCKLYDAQLSNIDLRS